MIPHSDQSAFDLRKTVSRTVPACHFQALGKRSLRPSLAHSEFADRRANDVLLLLQGAELFDLRRQLRFPYSGRPEKEKRSKRFRLRLQSKQASFKHRAHAGDDMVVPFDFGKQVSFESVQVADDGGMIGVHGRAAGLRNVLRSHCQAAWSGRWRVNHSGYEPSGLIGGISRLQNGFSQWRMMAVNFGSFRSLNAGK